MPSPPDDLATFIGANVAGLTQGTNLFAGSMRPTGETPTNSMFVRGQSGGSPSRTLGAASTQIRFAFLECVLRWSSQGGGDTQIRLVQDGIQNAVIAGYEDVFVFESEPTNLGPDDSNNYLFSLSVNMTYEN